MTFPITIQGIQLVGSFKPAQHPGEDHVGSWVAVRPVSGEGADKTFLGVYIGDLPTSLGGGVTTEGVLQLKPVGGNPAIWVPDLKQVVMGYESWWGPLEKPEDLKQITDADIQNIWYVKALKDLSEKTTANEQQSD